MPDLMMARLLRASLVSRYVSRSAGRGGMHSPRSDGRACLEVKATALVEELKPPISGR